MVDGGYRFFTFLRLGSAFRHRDRRRGEKEGWANMTASRTGPLAILASAAAIGAIAGIQSADVAGGRSAAATPLHGAAVATGTARARPPRAGDIWGGCNDARAAGTAPIYRDEPGYREDMDGDGDGIACEPVR